MLSERAVRPQPLVSIVVAGVPGEEQNLTPSIGFFIGAGFAEWLSQRTGKPLDQLRISVSGAMLSRPFVVPARSAQSLHIRHGCFPQARHPDACQGN